ncbi:MAG: triose-phosphate isomerase [Immundisolibacteraceae bacterium]|nr:triose-phosphate isomerase [Immundisolibacteraceae bacterium]
MRQPLVVGNWKMHGSRRQAIQLVGGLLRNLSANQAEVVLCPPFVLLADVVDLLVKSSVGLGAQDVAIEAQGAFTGEVAAEMVADIGCRYVIVGHSERRTLFNESDALVAEKVAATLRAGLVPIVCVGETAQQREAGDTEAVIAAQLSVVFERLGGADRFVRSGAVVAYEPVWAIGTGITAEPQQVVQVHRFIRGLLGELGAECRVLYGGSVKPANAAELFELEDVDGGLIGGASLDIDSFSAICAAAD